MADEPPPCPTCGLEAKDPDSWFCSNAFHLGRQRDDESREPWSDTCCFCGAHLPLWGPGGVGRGNNPEPLASWPERCCDGCNASRVIPERIRLMTTEGGW